MYMFRAIWEFAQSADCVAQTEDPQTVCQSADWHAICRLRNLQIVQTVEAQIPPSALKMAFDVQKIKYTVP